MLITLQNELNVISLILTHFTDNLHSKISIFYFLAKHDCNYSHSNLSR